MRSSEGANIVPSPEVQDRLQQALGAAYTIEGELGGAGMSRVFVAEELALGSIWHRRELKRCLSPP
jgi:serine/threonine-protein kinase